MKIKTKYNLSDIVMFESFSENMCGKITQIDFSTNSFGNGITYTITTDLIKFKHTYTVRQSSIIKKLNKKAFEKEFAKEIARKQAEKVGK